MRRVLGLKQPLHTVTALTLIKMLKVLDKRITRTCIAYRYTIGASLIHLFVRLLAHIRGKGRSSSLAASEARSKPRELLPGPGRGTQILAVTRISAVTRILVGEKGRRTLST